MSALEPHPHLDGIKGIVQIGQVLAQAGPGVAQLLQGFAVGRSQGQPARQLRKIGGHLVAHGQGMSKNLGFLADLFVAIASLENLLARLRFVLGRIAEEQVFTLTTEEIGFLDLVFGPGEDDLAVRIGWQPILGGESGFLGLDTRAQGQFDRVITQLGGPHLAAS